ncbi:MAG: alpha/beta hydrolase [Candidatus Jorgensenbacteria bacterium]
MNFVGRNGVLKTLYEGNKNASAIIVFAHGFGAGKDETGNYFVDLAKALGERFQIFRFDFFGYGESGGRQERTNLATQADDLRDVVRFARGLPNVETVYLLAHSMGAFAAMQCRNLCISRAVFTGIPNPDVETIRTRLAGAMRLREGGAVYFSGVSRYPRTSGVVQLIGSSFWTTLAALDPVELITGFAAETPLTIIRPSEDEIVSGDGMERYRVIPKVRFVEMSGSHNFAGPADRTRLIEFLRGDVFSDVVTAA